MADWILVPCLVQLRADLNAIAPGRDRASDGSIADNLHGNTSDHCADEDSPALRHKDADRTNEVHAIDVDRDLNTPGLYMEDVVQHILGRCRSGAEKRLRYIIFDRRIWEASNGWQQRAYTGPNAHDHHAHFSSSYESAREASKASWHLEDIPVALTEADKTWLKAEIRTAVRDLLTVDADPSARAYSLGGMVATIERRSDSVANTQFPALSGQVNMVGKAVISTTDALLTRITSVAEVLAEKIDELKAQTTPTKADHE